MSKRDLFTEGFIATDFIELMGPGQGGPAIDVWAKFTPEAAQLLAEQATRVLRKALEKAVVVSNEGDYPRSFNFSWNLGVSRKATSTALLVRIEEVGRTGKEKK